MKRYMKFIFITIISCLLYSNITIQPVFAEPIIDPNQKGSIIIQPFAVNNLNDYQTPATGEEQDISDLQKIPNISYTVTRVLDTDTTPANATALTGEQEYQHTLPTNEQGIVTFDNLNHGVYLVQQAENESIDLPIADFLVSVPMTNAAGTAWIYDIYVYPKNQLVDVPNLAMYAQQLNVKSTSLNRNDTIDWITTTEIPNDILNAKEYQLSYQLHSYLPYQDNVRVYSKKSDSSDIDLEVNTDYTLSQEDNDLTITITEEGKRKLNSMFELENTSFKPIMYTTFSNTLTIPDIELPEALSDKFLQIPTFTYSNTLGISNTIKLDSDDIPYTYTGGIVIEKTDGNNNSPLAGAKFKLYTSLNDANAGNNALQDPINGGDWEVTTDQDGHAAFYGIAYGIDNATMENATSTYYLIETKAPDGFNLLGSPLEITVDKNSHTMGNQTTITNNTGFTLPITGGIGTLLFTVIGISLIAGAVYLYRRSKIIDPLP